MGLLMVSMRVRIEVVFDAGGVTVAVLGTPIDKIYPRSNLSLAQRILEKGAIISEYPVGTETKRSHFLERNRLVSGLADATVIVEASEKSGTIHTAACALEQGRKLFVVPGDIARPMSVGCNKMLSGPAEAYIDFDSFIRKGLNMLPKVRRRSRLVGTEKDIVQQIKQGVLSGDEIAQNLKIDISKFNHLITVLEMKGVVNALGCNNWGLA